MSFHTLMILPMLAAAPYALIETRDVDQTDSNNFQVSVRAVDGKGYFGPRYDMKMEPGAHFIQMTSEYSSKKIARANHDKSLYLNMKPCMRYIVTGQVKTDLDRDWTIRVLGSERILACKTKEEIEQEKLDKKAKKAAAKQAEKQDSAPNTSEVKPEAL